MTKSTGSVTSTDFTGGKLVLTITDGCNRFFVKVRKTAPTDADSYADGMYVNVDALHEDTEPGFLLQKGESREFITVEDIIGKVTLTAVNGAAIPAVDFGVTGRKHIEE